MRDQTFKTPEELLGLSPPVKSPNPKPTPDRLREIARLAGKELEKPTVTPVVDRPKQHYEVT